MITSVNVGKNGLLCELQLESTLLVGELRYVASPLFFAGAQAMTESLLVLPLPELKGTPMGGPLFLGNKLPHSATILALTSFLARII